MRAVALALALLASLLIAMPTTASSRVVPVWYPWPRPHHRAVALTTRPVLRRVVVVATSYCMGTTTATGEHVRRGIVAVDPRVIPLGSRLYVPGYGAARAEDTGSAIVGDRIDVYLAPTNRCAASWQWGRRRVQVDVLGPKIVAEGAETAAEVE